ncbi:MAG: peptidase calpain [Thermoleophilia bacterium]|nr:peptidase calpain [Thermoleophilia bacterium]
MTLITPLHGMAGIARPTTARAAVAPSIMRAAEAWHRGPAPTALGGVIGLRDVRPATATVVIDGAELLANPRLPDNAVGARWGVPLTGSVFEPLPRPAVSLEHVDQGRLGDCGFVATMGSVAHYDPVHMRGMVREAGDFVIVDFPDRSVAVTRELPLRGLTDEPMYAGKGSDDAVLWPAYVEKAQAARAAEGYMSLKGCKASTAFLHLYGVQPVKLPAHAGGPMTDALQALREGTPVVLSTRGTKTAPPELAARMDAINLHRTHAYVPIAAGVDEAGEATVTLFNPWGHLHPTRPVTRTELREMVVRAYTPSTERSYPLPRAASAAS